MFEKGAYAERGADFKLIIPAKGREPELYNPTKDTGEKTNLLITRSAELEVLE